MAIDLWSQMAEARQERLEVGDRLQHANPPLGPVRVGPVVVRGHSITIRQYGTRPCGVFIDDRQVGSVEGLLPKSAMRQVGEIFGQPVAGCWHPGDRVKGFGRWAEFTVGERRFRVTRDGDTVLVHRDGHGDPIARCALPDESQQFLKQGISFVTTVSWTEEVAFAEAVFILIATGVYVIQAVVTGRESARWYIGFARDEVDALVKDVHGLGPFVAGEVRALRALKNQPKQNLPKHKY